MKTRFPRLTSVILALAILITPLAASARTDAEVHAERTSTASSASQKSKKYTHPQMKRKIEEYAADNKEVKGYLIVPGTNIFKPVAFNDTNNIYYTNRDIKGVNYPNNNYSNFKQTAEFLDYRTRFGKTWKQSSRNMVIYGHNWTNLREPLAIGSQNRHTMFGQLPSYTNLDFARQNPHVYFSTMENEGIWRVFAVAYAETKTTFNYNSPNTPFVGADPGEYTSADYAKFLGELKNRSLLNFDVDVKPSDNILTLSTCTRQYGQGSQQRFIVVARLLRPGESENDAVNVERNPNPKPPQF